VASAALLSAALAIAGCGGGGADEHRGGPLEWKGTPTLLETPRKALILRGVVTNRSGHEVEVAAKDLKLRDARGRRIPAAAQFISGFVKSLRQPNKQPIYPRAEQIRIGRLATVEPGKNVPLTVSWFVRRGRAAARIDYGQGSLPVPARGG
jgi:hypothetical protein